MSCYLKLSSPQEMRPPPPRKIIHCIMQPSILSPFTTITLSIPTISISAAKLSHITRLEAVPIEETQSHMGSPTPSPPAPSLWPPLPNRRRSIRLHQPQPLLPISLYRRTAKPERLLPRTSRGAGLIQPSSHLDAGAVAFWMCGATRKACVPHSDCM